MISKYIDNFGVSVVLRETLIKKFKSLSAKNNFFVTAPGGYGKTVAVSQWLAGLRGNKAKLMIGKADNQPGYYYKRMASALLKITGKEKLMPDTVSSFDRLLEIVKLLPVKNGRCYLVVDDAHMINNEEIIKHTSVLAQRLPDYIRWCIISRSEPTAAFLQTGLFEVITESDLLFSPEEVEWLGAENGLKLTAAQIKRLLDTTGGWAMYLSAMLSGGHQPDKKKTPVSLTQYIEARIWEQSEEKDLLLRLAIPDEINPELCERLTGLADGRGLLERLSKTGNTFLSLAGIDSDTYCFHDIFREFLQERMERFLGQEEFRRLNDIAAKWYYEQGKYYAGARHFINNNDHEGINRCMEATNRYHEETGSISVETRLHFIQQYVTDINPEFIEKNPFLISKCAVAAFHNGDTEVFLQYLDSIYAKIPEISSKYPELMGTVGFIFGLDFRTPYKEWMGKMTKLMPLVSSGSHEARTSTITQNLPFFHRSMRDFYEYHALQEDELTLHNNVGMAMIGDDFSVMMPALTAGVYYERGELIEANHYAMTAYRASKENMHPETVFCSHMILAAVFYAMGASTEADEIMKQMEGYIACKAQFLNANFKALQTGRTIRIGDLEAAREWLEVYATNSNRLPFYQICQHFTTLRSHIAVSDYQVAVSFGKRLLTLVTEYNRPLDQIESGLLTAIALWHNGDKKKAIRELAQAVKIAMPYGFIQLFINEAKEVLPMLWELKKSAGVSAEIKKFADKLTDYIYKKRNLNQSEQETIKLSKQQSAMLRHLSKGMSYSEIAEATGLGHGTVKYHVLLVYKKLGVHNVEEAVLKAKTMGLLD